MLAQAQRHSVKLISIPTVVSLPSGWAVNGVRLAEWELLLQTGAEKQYRKRKYERVSSVLRYVRERRPSIDSDGRIFYRTVFIHYFFTNILRSEVI